MAKDKRTIVFYVNSSYGIGHYVRMSRVAQQLTAREGISIIFITAGVQFPLNFLPNGVNWIQLPSLTFLGDNVENTFQGELTTKRQIFQHRARMLKALLESTKVDLFLIEYYPFSKYELADEVKLAVDWIRSANQQASVVVSLREVIHSDAIFHADHIADFVNKHCNALLIHGDPCFITFNSSYPKCKDLRVPLIYTGFVTQTHIRYQNVSDGPVLFSMGGGRDGHSIVEALHEIARQPQRPDLIIFPGPFLPEDQKNRLETITQMYNRVCVCDFEKYAAWIPRASSSVCQGGYNTIWELLSSRVPTLVLPRNRPEQRIRAERLASIGLLKCCSNPKELGDAFQRRDYPVNAAIDFDFRGDEGSAMAIMKLCQ